MLRLKDIIHAKKTISDSGKPSAAKMSKTAFPMSKVNGIRLGTGWHWRVICFTAHCAAGDVCCRLLVAFHPGKNNYQSYLGVIRGNDTVLLARYEYHSDHSPPGWHLHAKCVEIGLLVPGIVKGPYVRRYPEGHKMHRRNEINVTSSEFLAPAFKAFGIELT